jgi:hypothetical protein
MIVTENDRFPDLVLAASLPAFEASNPGATWSPWAQLPGVNVAALALGVRPKSGLARPDRKLAAALVEALTLQPGQRTIPHIVTTPSLATRLTDLLDGNFTQHVVAAMQPLSVLGTNGARRMAAPDGNLAALLRPLHGPVPQGTCIAVDDLIGADLIGTGRRMRRVQARWRTAAATADAPGTVLEIVGDLLTDADGAPWTGAGRQTWAMLRRRDEQGLATCRLPLDLAEATLRRLVAVAEAPELAPWPFEVVTPAPGYEELRRATAKVAPPLLARAILRHTHFGRDGDQSSDTWGEVSGVPEPIGLLRLIPLDVLQASVRRWGTITGPVGDPWVASLNAATVIAALTLGEGFRLQRRGADILLEGAGCSAVFHRSGRLVRGEIDSGVMTPAGVSDGELRAWESLPPQRLALIDGAAVTEPSGAFMAVARLIDRDALSHHLVHRNVVSHVDRLLRERGRPAKGALVVVEAVADPRHRQVAAASAVKLLGDLRVAGYKVRHRDADVASIAGFTRWSEADGDPDVIVDYHGVAPDGMPTIDAGPIIHVAAHWPLIGKLSSPVPLVIAWCAGLILVRTAKHDSKLGWVEVVDDAYDATTQRHVWPLVDGRVLQR